MRDLPPTPPIESKAKGKESNTPNATTPGAHACVCEGAREPAGDCRALPPVIDVRTPPTLETLLAFAHLRCGFHDDDFTREWHRLMTEEYMWRHPDTGRRIAHWPAYFRKWRTRRRLFEKLLDPGRIADARTRGNTQLPVNRLLASDEFERSFCDDLA